MNTDNHFNGTVSIVSSYLQTNSCPLEKVTTLIEQVHNALSSVRKLSSTSSETVFLNSNLSPAVPLDQSITDDYIVCLEDGRRVRSLKSYLRRFDLTPDSYRTRWGLPSDYPMVAPALSEKRSAIARHNRPHLSRKREKGGISQSLA